ncbi:MAG: hypothetical protein F4W90_11330, partial [Gammaproteobacteria bacterium]|nr:hypothetical protein [Gammaproteobacteria bacterium]
MPTGDREWLTKAELRWCRAEKLRLQGEAEETNREDFWEVYDYNQNVKQERDLCLGRRFDTVHGREIEGEFNETVQAGIRKAGMRRTIYSRVSRKDRLMHVASSQASVFDSDQSRMNRIDSLERWYDVYRMGEKSGVFSEVEWLEDSDGS